MEEPDLYLFEQTISYEFKDKNLLREALRHSSYVNEQPDTGLRDNERLEFLGDAVLNLVVGHILMQRYPELKEGELSRLRAGMVNESRVAAFAVAVNLGNYIRFGKGELQTRGRKKKSILANAFEALVAAIYLDQGWKSAADFVLRCLNPWLQKIAQSPRPNDPKSLLQELVQEKKSASLSYLVVDESGPDHDRQFVVQVRLDGQVIGEGRGKSKQAAEEQAAESALKRLMSASLS